VFELLARKGCWNIIKWFFEKGRDMKFFKSTDSGFDLLTWNQTVKEMGSAAITAAAEGGKIAILEWINKVAPQQLKEAAACPGVLACVARRGELEVLQWLRKRGVEWDASLPAHAARGGQLEVLVWAKKNGCPWDGLAVREIAAELGYLEIVGWVDAHSVRGSSSSRQQQQSVGGV